MSRTATRSPARGGVRGGSGRRAAGYRVSHPSDAAERQADCAADVVARGGSVSGWSFGSVAPSAPVVHREGAAGGGKEDETEEALTTTAEAALATTAGKRLQERVLGDPLVKQVTAFASTPAGIAALAAGGAAAIGGLAAAGKELPVALPTIPLDAITPGLSAKVEVEGPLNAPTKVGLTLTYEEQGPGPRKGPSSTEAFRAETARLAAEQAKFRAGLRFPPGSEQAEEQKAEQEAIARFVASRSLLPGIGRPLIPLTGGPVTSGAPQPDKAEDEESKPLHREPAAVPPSGTALDTGGVADALAGGRPLEPAVRRSMEARFGVDLGAVRVHDDATAARSARALRALAFTVEDHVVFDTGRYAPGTSHGDRLLAHELTHVVQQRSAAPHVQRADAGPPPAPDAETALGKKLRDPTFSTGFSLAFYDEDEPEAERRAADFATRESALGLKGPSVTAAAVVVGKAIPGSRKIDKTVPAIASVVQSALAKVPAPAAAPPAVGPPQGAAATPQSTPAPGKVRALAIFAHGTPQWCSAGVTVSNAPAIFTAIAPYLSSSVRVVLYTCSSARGTGEDEDWVKGTMRGGGEDSLAATVRDTLAKQKVVHGSVWGHTTVGHTSRNFALREFRADDGLGAEGRSYVSEYVFTDAERAWARAELAAVLRGQGYSVTEADPAFVSATAVELERTFYNAYAAANKNLTGDNVAERAPLEPTSTAARIVDHWRTSHWPAHREGLARRVVKRMRLKKP